ncbi:MAG: acyloxyacyl hydrolase [Pseudomonas sp.]|jgi:lipid A 3-O-deacylase|uniref:acyloxyacyl hydrolase n=1 Tax=Halopseudomonas TaxID=2901189 RepID=UPI001B7695BB|nr:acyloxyacyl hydrolase [Pseudomonas sp.]MBQ0778964.1 acyloxyacyl hydrolase [Pseudomonas sp.]WOD10771.1 acyloxyacyl hydrolase [Pseudomonas sp. NyZ704]
MKKSSLWVMAGLCAALLTQPAFAARGFTLELGQSSESEPTYRAGMQFDFGKPIWQSDGGAMELGGYWDAGLTYWDGIDAFSATLAPMFQLNFPRAMNTVTPFVEAGIGAALFSKTDLAPGADIGSTFQFEDRIGLGMRFASGSELGVRYYHYSNASIKQPNQGIDKAALYYRVNF